jgi:hypothetical protein
MIIVLSLLSEEILETRRQSSSSQRKRLSQAEEEEAEEEKEEGKLPIVAHQLSTPIMKLVLCVAFDELEPRKIKLNMKYGKQGMAQHR